MPKGTWSLYQYGKDTYKLVFYLADLNGKKINLHNSENSSPDERLSNSISRTKSTINELALCNEFTHFCTFTQDKQLRDRFDLDAFIKDFSMFVRNENRGREASGRSKIEYLLIPEQHKDGAWHLHGLLKGLDNKDLVKNEHGYLDWVRYRSRFGFFSVSLIRSKRRCANYVTKYVTKDINKTAIKAGRHYFYASQGLKRKEAIIVNSFDKCPVEKWEDFDFYNDFVPIKRFSGGAPLGGRSRDTRGGEVTADVF